MGKFVDLTGQKFGRLTVIERAENKGKKICWLCKCDCGTMKVIRGGDLKSGRTASCGCLQVETTKKLNEERWQDDEFRQKHTEKMKKVWENEEFRRKKSDQMKKLNEEQWQDEDFRKMKSERSKEMWQDEEFRKMKSEKVKEQWQDEEMKWKMGYKGGITPISRHLRDLNSQWFEDCKQKANYTCQLTGKHGGNLHTHHLKAFSMIVIEAHKLHNIEIKDQVKDYTQEELKLLEEYVGSWHKDNSNAVVLSEDVHNLFHKLYGKGENTPEQFEEFKERYIAGEFKEILN